MSPLAPPNRKRGKKKIHNLLLFWKELFWPIFKRIVRPITLEMMRLEFWEFESASEFLMNGRVGDSFIPNLLVWADTKPKFFHLKTWHHEGNFLVFSYLSLFFQDSGAVPSSSYDSCKVRGAIIHWETAAMVFLTLRTKWVIASHAVIDVLWHFLLKKTWQLWGNLVINFEGSIKNFGTHWHGIGFVVVVDREVAAAGVFIICA